MFSIGVTSSVCEGRGGEGREVEGEERWERREARGGGGRGEVGEARGKGRWRERRGGRGGREAREELLRTGS